MTAPILPAARALLAAATERPWLVQETPGGIFLLAENDYIAADTIDYSEAPGRYESSLAAFSLVALAVNLLPSLLDVAEAADEFSRLELDPAHLEGSMRLDDARDALRSALLALEEAGA